MSVPALEIFPDEGALARAFARHFAQAAGEAIRTRGRFLAVLSGGCTPLRAYRLLAQEPLKSRVDWRKVHLFWGDERFVPPDDPESNFHQARRALLARISIPQANVHPMPVYRTPEAAARAYARLLATFAEPGSAVVRFDLVMLGLGSDGHVASLFVGQSARWVSSVIVAEGRYRGRPAMRLTLTPVVFNQAREVVFLVSGAAKADALAKAMGEARDENRIPAQAIQPQGGVVRWMVDAEAASAI